MNLLTLPRNVQFLYEEHLARIEMRALGCDGWDRVGDDPKLISLQVQPDVSKTIQRAAYVGEIDGCKSVYEQLITPDYQGGKFNRTPVGEPIPNPLDIPLSREVPSSDGSSFAQHRRRYG